MTPKRGQPPKPPEKQRTERIVTRYTKDEMELLDEAYRLSESQRPFSRWLADFTVEEIRKMIESHKK